MACRTCTARLYFLDSSSVASSRPLSQHHLMFAYFIVSYFTGLYFTTLRFYAFRGTTFNCAIILGCISC